MFRTRNLILLFLIAGIFLTSPRGWSQELVARHITVESGIQLPSNEVYDLLIDRDNIIWATTDRGVWSYDGYAGTQYTVADGLRDNANLRIFKDNRNRIWVSSMTNYLDYIDQGKVFHHPAGRAIHEYPARSAFIQQIGDMEDTSVLVTFNQTELLRFVAGKMPEPVRDQRKNHEDATLAIRYSPDDFCWDMIHLPGSDTSQPSRVESENGWTYLSCNILYDNANSLRKNLSPIGPNEFVFSFCNKLFHIRDGRKVGEATLPEQVIDICADREGNFWAGLDKGRGVLEFPKGNLSAKPVNYLKGETITGIVQDHEGNYWFATGNNGIYFVNTLKVITLQNSSPDTRDNMITAMVSHDGEIFMGTQSGLLLRLSETPEGQYRFDRLPAVPIDGAIRMLFITTGDHLTILADHYRETDLNGHPAGIGLVGSFPYALACRPEGEYLLSLTNRIQIIRNSKVIREWNPTTIAREYPADTLLPKAINRVRALYLDPDSTIWMGSQNYGLYSSRNQSIYHWADRDSLFANRIHGIIRTGKNIWVSVAGYGLAVIRPDSTFFRITQHNGLSSDIIDVLYPENDSVVWAGTNNGLNKITLHAQSEEPEIAYYTMREGLPSNRIFTIIKHQGNIWVGTTQGAIRLDRTFNLPPAIHPRVILSPVVVNGVPRPLKDSAYLHPGETNLVFHFKTVNYRKPSTIRYRYKLAGADRDYIYTTNLECRYPELRYGQYTFRVNASYDDYFDPATEQILTFWIQKRWYQTVMAWVIILMILSAAVLMAFLSILKGIKIREMEKRRLLMAEKNSLLAQMNPHFIFNSLNSIQHFIIQNDEVQANNYLSSFSGLIRRILENSKKNLITLSEEISTLTLYLGMEKLRFENDFEFEIIRDPRIDYNETQIPPMMIQPLVENAIWHGIMPLKTKGKLKITFRSDGNYYTCQVEDNGIGREKAAQLRRNRRTHVATGIRNIEERIELLNKLNKKEMRLTILDLRDENGEARGTLAELVMPLEIKI